MMTNDENDEKVTLGAPVTLGSDADCKLYNDALDALRAPGTIITLRVRDSSDPDERVALGMAAEALVGAFRCRVEARTAPLALELQGALVFDLVP